MTQSTSRTTERITGATKDQTTTTLGYAAPDMDSPLEPVRFERRALRAHDVHLEVLHSGVCHSDLHQVRDEWHDTQPTQFPCLPGHEIVGRVAAVGEHVTRFAEGDIVGVGCMVDSCQHCEPCRQGTEQYCEEMPTMTYNAEDRVSGEITFGGYSQSMVVCEDFVLSIPDGLDHAAAAPILCAGVTMWSPMKHWKIGKGHKVGIAGIGGLGHMGIQIATALGAEVTALTTSEEKRAEAERLGAANVLVMSDADAVKEAEKSLTHIIATIPFGYDTNDYLQLLELDGVLINCGALEPLQAKDDAPAPDGFHLAMGRRTIAGSIIGGIEETQEVLEFCAEHGISSDIQSIRMDEINDAFEKMNEGEVRFRYVIDMSSMDDADASAAKELDTPAK